MRNIPLLLLTTFALSGCFGMNPVKNPFPDAPAELMRQPAEIKTVQPYEQSSTYKLTDITPSGVPLSVLTKIVTENYKNANLNKEQILRLQEWITQQKQLNN